MDEDTPEFNRRKYETISVDQCDVTHLRECVQTVGIGPHGVRFNYRRLRLTERCRAQCHNAVYNDPAAIASRAILSRSVQYAIFVKWRTPGSCRTDINLDRIPCVRVPRPFNRFRVPQVQLAASALG